VDKTDGLLAEPANFYTKNLFNERAAYALEWLNAFSHLDRSLREGLVPHGGTLAQLHLGPAQRVSRDVDLLGRSDARPEKALDAVAARYKSQLFTWREDAVANPPIRMRRFSIFFPAAPEQGEKLVPLKVEVTYLDVQLPTVNVRLSSSAVYRPKNESDDVETLTVDAFIADKLPTLGFDQHGYPRPSAVDEAHAEQVWKQLNDLSGLVSLGPDVDNVLSLYRTSIRARNSARGRTFSATDCLAGALRVCRVALAAERYPSITSVQGDDSFETDVLLVRGGLGPFRAYSLAGTVRPLLAAARTLLLVSCLISLETGMVNSEGVRILIAHCRDIERRLAAKGPVLSALATELNGRQDPQDWSVPMTSQTLFRASPAAAALVYVAGRLAPEVEALRKTRRLSWEPDG